MKNRLFSVFLSTLLSLGMAQNALASENPESLDSTQRIRPLRQRVVLLTSFNPKVPGISNWLQFRYKNYMGGLEKIFVKTFLGKGYDIEIQRHANQEVIHTELNSPENVAIFLVSHGGDGAMVDENGFDYTPLLHQAHPNLRYLALIGCDSLEVSDQIRSKLPQARIRSFPKKIDAKKGLKAALDGLENYLGSPSIRHGYHPACPAQKGHRIRVTRTVPADSQATLIPSVRIEHKNRILGAFPPSLPGKAQEIEIFLPEPAVPVRAVDLKMQIYAGANPGLLPGQVELGRFEFQAPWSGGQWKLFADAQGKPVGVAQHIYRYVGSTPLGESTAEQSPYLCEAMPARP